MPAKDFLLPPTVGRQTGSDGLGPGKPGIQRNDRRQYPKGRGRPLLYQEYIDWTGPADLVQDRKNLAPRARFAINTMTHVAVDIFWLCFGLVSYTYFGYPVILFV